MPYKHEYTHTKLPRKLDRRVRLTEQDKVEIKKLISTTNLSNTQIAEQYGVHRKTIYLIRNPEQAKKEKEAYKIRRSDWRYYNKDKQREAIKETRRYKQENKDVLINWLEKVMTTWEDTLEKNKELDSYFKWYLKNI